jgi:hypothetical protein
LERFEISSLLGVSGVSEAAGSANFAVALDKEDNTVTAEETAVVKAAILESIDSAKRLPEDFFPVPGVTPG